MMSAKSCQCQIPRQPYTAGVSSWYGRRSLGFSGNIDQSSPHSIGVDNDKSFFVPYKALEAYDSADAAHFKDGTKTGTAEAGVPLTVMDYSYLMHGNGNTTSPNDWDSLVAYVVGPDGQDLGWIECAYYYQDKSGKEIAANYGAAQPDKTPPSKGEVQSGAKAASDADYAIMASKQEIKDAAEGGKKDESDKKDESGKKDGSGWGFSFGDSKPEGGAAKTTEDTKTTKTTKDTKDTKDTKTTKATGGGAGLAVGLGALALLLASKK